MATRIEKTDLARDALYDKVNTMIDEVNTKIDNKDSLPSQTGNAGKFLTTDGTNASWGEVKQIEIKQDLTNPSADTVPSTKAVSDESSRITTLMNTELAKKLNVNATTRGEITDLRTPRLNEGNTSTVYIDGYMINSEDDINGCLVAPVLFADGTIGNRLIARKKVNGVNFYRQLIVGVKADGSPYTVLEKSNDNNSIVTTVSHGSNYVRFGNGLQICWGRCSTAEQTVTLPQPFKDTNYIVNMTLGPDEVNKSNDYCAVISDIKTTRFKKGDRGQLWTAMGYWY